MSAYWDVVDPVWDDISIDAPDAFLDSFARAPRKAGLLYAAHFYQSEVCNGGFHQFFYNSTGVLAPEAMQGFHAIGQDKVAGLIETAIRRFGAEYPRDRELRISLLEGLGKRSFDDLDDRFYALIHTEAGGFEAAADAYAAGN